MPNHNVTEEHYHESSRWPIYASFWLAIAVGFAALGGAFSTNNKTASEISDPVAQQIAACSMLPNHQHTKCLDKIKFANPD